MILRFKDAFHEHHTNTLLKFSQLSTKFYWKVTLQTYATPEGSRYPCTHKKAYFETKTGECMHTNQIQHINLVETRSYPTWIVGSTERGIEGTKTWILTSSQH